MKLRQVLLILVLCITPFWASATHVVGGSLTYEHLGGSTYRLTIKMYRDCGPTSVNLPGSATVDIRQPNGTFITSVTLPRTQVSVLNPPIDTCAFDPGVCVEEGIYTDIVNNLPPNPGGYHLVYRTCCRNASLVNVNNPLGSGSSYYSYIPDNSLILTNSSPQWKNFTPVFVCQGNPLVFDHGATDKDGDSLAYAFYNPFDNNAPTFPGNIATFTPIVYNGGYSFTNPLGGGGFAVNPTTGVITGVPPALGQYVVGVKVDEFRNGVLINTVYREFQFNVLNCPPIPQPGIAPVTGCSGLAINFTNTSVPLAGNSFYWDFGDPASTTDNSTLTNPNYAYPSIGSYIVMLVAQAGTPCADTIYDTLIISGLVPDFTLTDSVCVNAPVTFNDISVPTINATVNSWIWDFGDGVGSAVTPTPTYTYNTPGTYTVQLISGTTTGCLDSITKTIFVQSLPIALAVDTFACLSNPVTNLNGSVFGAAGGIWSAPGGGSLAPGNTDLNAAYTPSSADTAAGFATLILSTTGNGFCPAASDTMILSFSVGITAIAGPDISVCKDSASVPLTGNIVTASGGQWISSGTGTFVPNPFDLNAVYLPSSADTAAGSVFIYLNSIGNGNCVPDSDTILVTFTATPTVAILSNDTACAGSIFIPISATSTTGSGYWQTFGTGFFSPNDSLNTSSYFADSLDNLTGNVTLVFTSTNNGGCQSFSDTLNIALIPAPVANFSFVSVCPNDTILFNDLSTFVDPIISWDWDFNNSFIGNTPNTSTVYDTAGIYNVSLIVSSANGCIDTLVQPVLVFDFPIANFGVNGVCEGVNSLFIDSSTVNGSTIATWMWDFGDGGTNTIQNPVYTYASSGSYTVELIVQSAQGCLDTMSIPISIQGPPTAGYTSTPPSVKVDEVFNFLDGSFTNIVSWDWDFGDTLGISTDQHPTYSYSEAGNYTVCLRVTDTFGCMDSICNDVIVFMPPAVPNAFSPNGQGANNVFSVLGGPYKELEFRIYNNWGELIFESNEQNRGWDGTRDGINQPIGVYIYTVRAVTLDDEKHSIKGDVTLLR